MADQQVGNIHGLPVVAVGDADSRSNLSGTAAPQTGFVDTDSVTISALRSRLATIDAGYYTAARLNNMTYNDMVYAVRLADNAGTIAQ